MAEPDILQRIPQLVKANDVAALAALRDHDDKAVRKAIRKALHTLKSRGIEVPEGERHSWNPGNTLQDLRGDLTPVAVVDARSVAGALRVMLSQPDEDGAALWVATLSPFDRILGFEAYTQTDGQRTRMLRDWDRAQADRRAPVPWLLARIRWAREQTVRAGLSVPRALDLALPRLGALPNERPASFLGPHVADKGGLDAERIDEVLLAAGVPRWPPLIELDASLQRAAEIHGDKPQPTEEAERIELLRRSIEDDAAVRTALQGPIAAALEDAAVAAWCEGEDALASALHAMAAALRGAAEPEKERSAVRIVGYQVASLLRAVGGPEAVAKMMQAESQRVAGTQVHVHDENCDHDHDHA
jgi:hypothetical protein